MAKKATSLQETLKNSTAMEDFFRRLFFVPNFALGTLADAILFFELYKLKKMRNDKENIIVS